MGNTEEEERAREALLQTLNSQDKVAAPEPSTRGLRHVEATKRRGRLWAESKRVLGLAVPISLSEVVSFFAYLVTTAQVGHLGPLELSAITLARSVFHITGLSLVVGMGSAVETFCGQAHGAGRHGALGVVLQRAVLLCLATCCVPLALWTQADWIMLHVLGQRPEVVALAARYVQLLGPALCMWAVGTCINSYLRSQAVVTPLTVVAVLHTALTPLVNHVFMFRLQLGMVGAAVAYNVLQALELALLLGAAVWLHTCRQTPATHTWRGFSRQALAGWGDYLGIALPSAAAICLDWWTYEAVILIAGALPDAKVQLGAMGLAFNTHALLFMVVEGFGAAASTRVSNELGAGRGAAARYAGLVALALGAAAPLLASGALVAAPRPWARLYTEDGAIVDLVARLMPVLALSNIADSVASVTSGVLRGSGRQELAFKVNLGAYWLLGLPTAALLALRYRQGAMGLWLAMGAASALQAAILLGSMLHFDWPAEARKAQERAHAAAEAEAADHRGAVAGAAAGLLAAAGGPGGAAEGEGEGGAAGQAAEGEGPPRAPPLHAGMGSRHGVYEPLLTAEHVV
ncbi:hypothetical protein HYH02_007858 [Chlamydomonas schloesseri]|uniref:Protein DETOXIFICATION n=1 Tax=Chlamydomonas schloesseri TaxID=2026947 RepID=A0A836B447_9CHLO|nr:hypothetical protein HYH02_007858 [Chlamydomonas schloesseri]|eukprot:KAG2447110.1 hypothetical protein HYH02_007858 [Chlamydomonas schloesseri]